MDGQRGGSSLRSDQSVVTEQESTADAHTSITPALERKKELYLGAETGDKAQMSLLFQDSGWGFKRKQLRGLQVLPVSGVDKCCL